MSFSPEQLLQRLRRFPTPSRYLIAFSGGCDSTVLLHALAQVHDGLTAPVAALHIDHGWRAESAQWAVQCESTCAALSVPCTTVVISASARRGESREAAARQARYLALAAHMRPGDMLLTAHHCDDQAETVLLQLLRGAGVRGLAAMGPWVPFAQGWLARPLLDARREDLCRWAHEQRLTWINDPSNFDTTLDRNYLREEIMPALAMRWSGAFSALARASTHLAEASALLDDLARIDLASVAVDDTLSVSALGRLDEPRQRNLLRYVLRARGLPLPDTRRLQQIVQEVLTARPDAQPLVEWPGAQVRRYRDSLYLLAPLLPVPAGEITWTLDAPLTIPGLGRLHVEPGRGKGFRRDITAVTIRFGAAQGGRCRVAGRGGTHSLKNLWQEAAVPPWVRLRTPQLYLNEALIAIPGLCIDESAGVKPGDAGLVPIWEPFAVESEGENEDNLRGLAP